MINNNFILYLLKRCLSGILEALQEKLKINQQLLELLELFESENWINILEFRKFIS